MNFNIGDFIITEKSIKPGIIIDKEKEKERYKVAIYHKCGGYSIYINEINQIKTIKKVALQPCQELSIIANLGEWFYREYTLLYQEIILRNILEYSRKNIKD